MPNLFDGYCYATIDEASNAEISTPIFNASSGLVDFTGYTVTSATTVNLTFNYKTMIAGGPSVYTIPRTYPSCTSVGYLTNYTGLGLADAVTVSWLVVLVWSIAWGIKQMRRAL